MIMRLLFRVASGLVGLSLLAACGPSARDVRELPIVTSEQNYAVGEDRVMGDPTCPDDKRFIALALEAPMIDVFDAKSLLTSELQRRYGVGGMWMQPVDLEPEKRPDVSRQQRFWMLTSRDCGGMRAEINRQTHETWGMTFDEMERAKDHEPDDEPLRVPTVDPVPAFAHPPKLRVPSEHRILPTEASGE